MGHLQRCIRYLERGEAQEQQRLWQVDTVPQQDKQTGVCETARSLRLGQCQFGRVGTACMEIGDEVRGAHVEAPRWVCPLGQQSERLQNGYIYRLQT